MDTNIKGEFIFLAKPLALLTVIVVLIVSTLVFGLNQFTNIKSKIDTNKVVENTLKQKVVTLESVNELLSSDVTFLDIVLPGKGAVLYGLSQVKNQALSYNVIISSLKTGISTLESDEIYKTTISFEAESDEQSIYNFLESFSTTLPLMNVDKVSLNKSGDVARANISLSVYSSQMPTKIPAIAEAVKDFTQEEISLLQTISKYSLPSFVEPSRVQAETIKENPFE